MTSKGRSQRGGESDGDMAHFQFLRISVIGVTRVGHIGYWSYACRAYRLLLLGWGSGSDISAIGATRVDRDTGGESWVEEAEEVGLYEVFVEIELG